MAHISDLPVSIPIDIFHHAIENCDYLPLLLRSRQLHVIAEDIIHRDISENLLRIPDSCRRLRRLFKTVHHRRELASRLSGITIEYAWDILSLSMKPSSTEQEFIQELQVAHCI
jgi:hypothetical protein